MNTETRPARTWPLLLLALPAFVAICSGWVGLGTLTGFGVIQPLPGIPGADQIHIDTRITLPIGVETYAAYALRVWLAGTANDRARAFARWSAIGSLVLGAAGQVAYHLMVAAEIKSAPWQITALVACLPVAVLGMGVALAHLQNAPTAPAQVVQQPAPEPAPALADVVHLVDDAHRAAAADQRPPAISLPVPEEETSTPPATAEPAGLRLGAVEEVPRTTRRGATGRNKQLAHQMRVEDPDISNREIARRLDVTPQTVAGYFKTAQPVSD